MTVRYAVTFEFETMPPLTHKGQVQGSSAAVCANRAIKQAQKAHPLKAWSSLVCVLLERLA